MYGKAVEMAQKISVLLVCDLHDDEVEGNETIAFGLDGSAYEVDVCADHAAQVRDAFAPFVGAARRAGRPSAATAARRPARTGRVAASGSDRELVQAKREWARKNGFTVSDRGRLSAELLAAYDAAH
ncbi:MAG: putative lysyl tRNA synthetase-like protein [Frankiales bacterium]|jgi:hypothetical protein|nr:putative lysyl tRNA synthetase-like protein [Frankiales bacterium]